VKQKAKEIWIGFFALGKVIIEFGLSFSALAFLIIAFSDKYKAEDFFEVLQLTIVPFLSFITGVCILFATFAAGFSFVKNENRMVIIAGLILILLAIIGTAMFISWIYELSPYDSSRDESCYSARYC